MMSASRPKARASHGLARSVALAFSPILRHGLLETHVEPRHIGGKDDCDVDTLLDCGRQPLVENHHPWRVGPVAFADRT